MAGVSVLVEEQTQNSLSDMSVTCWAKNQKYSCAMFLYCGLFSMEELKNALKSKKCNIFFACTFYIEKYHATQSNFCEICKTFLGCW